MTTPRNGAAGTTQGAVIAGGQATRMGGRPKGLESVGGARILDRLVAVFEEALGDQPLLVANAEDAPTWRPGLRVIPDIRPGMGALGGIYTAVLAAPAPVVTVAWDMPFVTGPLIGALAAGLADADACLPESGGPRGLEPLVRRLRARLRARHRRRPRRRRPPGDRLP